MQVIDRKEKKYLSPKKIDQKVKTIKQINNCQEIEIKHFQNYVNQRIQVDLKIR